MGRGLANTPLSSSAILPFLFFSSTEYFVQTGLFFPICKTQGFLKGEHGFESRIGIITMVFHTSICEISLLIPLKQRPLQFSYT